MKNNLKFVCLFLGIVSVVVVGCVLIYLSDENKIIESSKRSDIKVNNNFLTMMYETEYQSGEYVVSTDSTWPHEGYTFNADLSGCENGSTLTWDDENKNVVLQANKSDKCYVYFDINKPTLATICSNGQSLSNCIETFYTTDGENGLYYHDRSGDYTNADQEAGDNSYRYAGANPNNYLCFGTDAETCSEDNLYRIIGVFNGQVKLIKSTSIGDYVWDIDNVDFSTIINTNNQDTNYKVMQLGDILAVPDRLNGSNIWLEADLNYYINNDYFYNTLTSDWQDKISTTIWYVGGGGLTQIVYGVNSTAKNAYNYEQGSNKDGTTYEAKVGLMYLNEYYYGASPTYWSYPGYTSSGYPDVNGNYGAEYDYRAAINDNWMFSGTQEWTISRESSDNFNVNSINIENDGSVGRSPINDSIYLGDDGTLAVRPAFYLSSDVLYASGDGTIDLPIRIVV